MSGLLTGANATFGSTGTGNNIIALSNNDQSNTRLRITNTGSGGQTFSIVGGNPGASNAGLAIFDETNSATRLYISSAGNVGIGTSSPWGKFNVVDGTNKSFVVQDAGIADTIELTNYSSGGGLRNISLTASTLIFNTGNAGGGTATERMRIPANGGLLIKQAVNNFGYEFRIANTLTNEWSFINGSDNQLYFGYNSSSRAVISQTTGNYTPLSDINKKKDFEESNIGLFEILCLKPTFYRMIDEEETSNKHLGFIAQEVKEFIPQAYYESKIGEEIFIGLQDRPIIAALVKAIQELEAKVSALESKI